MKIKYEFVNGDVIEIEAPDEIGEVIKESRKAEHADDERNCKSRFKKAICTEF